MDHMPMSGGDPMQMQPAWTAAVQFSDLSVTAFQ
jgi:hypothetical protein